MVPTLLIRADASQEMGTGHVMRCLALAQAWKDVGGNPIFAMSAKTESIESRLKSEGFEVISLDADPGSVADAYQTADISARKNACFVIVDGYHFGSLYQKLMKSLGVRFLFIDDNGHADHYYADIVLNQNIHADKKLYYHRENYTKLLLGTKYVLLRREFRDFRNWIRDVPNAVRNILVTFGGSDPTNATCKTIQALEQLNITDVQIRIVAGGSNYRYSQLQSFAESRHWIRIDRNVTNMPELMTWADIAVSAAGSTVWELAFMGLPSLIMIVADNQYKAASELDRTGCFKLVQEHNLSEELNKLLLSKSLRSSYAHRCKDLVDGDGCMRVLSAIFKEVEDLHD
ncbi:MAG: UDP-2,4-diacetamido-2,4,6-trideoxy-beta-L-altropyranose hydrolase [Methanothrix sp.]|jgi:UDP-2,4-diacetamido-2,4,6-trideoxy-beta-L-altropyranose hydrolase|nr:UDP-2,4-diacetamido-2,4,6-trideoxy-beta-L-altropyranose hydrolase [Methanothrix sp.]